MWKADKGSVNSKKEWQSSRHYKLLISAECFIKCQSASPWARHWKMAALWCAGTSPAALSVCVCLRGRERDAWGEQWEESIRVCAFTQVCACLCVNAFMCVLHLREREPPCMRVWPRWPPSRVAVKQNRVAECPLLYLPFCQYDTVLFQTVIFTFLTLSKEAIWTEILMIDILSLTLVFCFLLITAFVGRLLF